MQPLKPIITKLQHKKNDAKEIKITTAFWFTSSLQTKLKQKHNNTNATVLPAKSDSDVVFCLQLLSKTLTCTLHLS